MRVTRAWLVKEIAFEEDDLVALGNVVEAARHWLELCAQPGAGLVAVTQEEIAAMHSLIQRVFDAFEEQE